MFGSSHRQNNGRPTPWGLVLAVLASTVILFGLYAYFVMRCGYNWLFWVYLGLLLASALGYFIYNRAFSDAHVTYFMLPADWSEEQKNDFLAARDARKRNSKWLLILIFPLSITLMFDVIYLFFGDMLYSLFDSLGRGVGAW